MLHVRIYAEDVYVYSKYMFESCHVHVTCLYVDMRIYAYTYKKMYIYIYILNL